MPDLNDGLETFKLATNTYGFSAARIDDLDATEYTLVTLVFDSSSSTNTFRDEMKKTVDKIVEACRKSPRADNLLLRVCEFSSRFEEIHGFKKLALINPGDYNDKFNGGGMTALFEASENAILSTETYGKQLMENDYQVNAILFIITDGQNNINTATASDVKKALSHAVSAETVESLVSILIGLNIDNQTDQYLHNFKSEAGLTQYVNIGDATAPKLAKLAEFVSKSISAQSQKVGTGGPSQSLVF